MTKFDDFLDEFKKSKEGKDYELASGGKTYIIHSEELKKILRKALSKWEGASEVSSKGAGSVVKHKLSQGGRSGLYQETPGASDEFTLDKEKGALAITSSISPQAPQAPKPPKGIGSRPVGDYISRTYRKDEKTGRRSWGWNAKRGDEEREMTVQEAEGELNSLKSLPEGMKSSFSREISDLQTRVEELKGDQQASEAQKARVEELKEIGDQQASEAQKAKTAQEVTSFPFWKGWGGN